jgi:hypothetical protein
MERDPTVFKLMAANMVTQHKTGFNVYSIPDPVRSGIFVFFKRCFPDFFIPNARRMCFFTNVQSSSNWTSLLGFRTFICLVNKLSKKDPTVNIVLFTVSLSNFSNLAVPLTLLPSTEWWIIDNIVSGGGEVLK